MRSVRVPYFRIWYSGAFVILFTITVLLTLVSPTDLVYQSVRNHWLPNVFSIAGVYFLTALVCLFIWASRIYTNRAVLRDIPKPYVAVEAGEVPRKVRRLIERQWARSALVAWDSRPRDVSEELRALGLEDDGEDEDQGLRDEAKKKPSEGLFHRRSARAKTASVIPLKTALKAWGHIAHPGWSLLTTTTTTAGDGLRQTQTVHFWSVIVELPHLLEAKAVSLAPPDPSFALDDDLDDDDDSSPAPPPDPTIVALLQRPSGMGVRDYLAALCALTVVEPASAAETFVAQYEYARFSTQPLTEPQFEMLMAAFAALLAAMSLDESRMAIAVREVDGSSLDSSSSGVSRSRSRLRRHHLHSTPSLRSEASEVFRGGSSQLAHSPSASFRSFSSVIINPQVH
jgi:Domain of unknown function (DUF4129)